ncbi:MAG: FAD-dependent oxidoreductase [Rhodospirillaceae bacterium]|jgi:dimethylamine/trimethylamine dehydrogenase|nr:FAD-dependent oxidoreductase [Rhodospirillaceae bacterium]
MARDPRYDILFEPVQIGPVTAPNRFYQVPHCSGMGNQKPQTLNAMREIKAEGGWGVVCTEYCSIHPSSDDHPGAYCTIWDEGDVRNLADMTDRVHRHGALAGVELWYGGYSSPNRLSRQAGFASESMPGWQADPVQTRAMDKADIAELRRWNREAAIRSKQAGFDIIYVYAGHGYLIQQFLSRLTNTRTDEYGGSLENRVRLLRELIEETREAVGDKRAVAVRLAVDELQGPAGITCDGEGREIVEMLAEEPDLWDVNISDFPADAMTSRFVKEGAQEDYIAFVKNVTTKPVVGVGRFTSPDTMVSQIKRGIMDMIGAARPSIADPFLPKKIEEGRPEDIRECIGCNTCVSFNGQGTPMRCTQNPTKGEEWRRGWHPEVIPARDNDDQILVIGAGPAGLEAARALGQRGHQVALAEASNDLGGRVTREATLPGLAEWARVRDWRLGQIEKMPNVDIFRASDMTAPEVLEFSAARVALATGSTWRRDGRGRGAKFPIPGADQAHVYSPDDIMDGVRPEGPVLVYDDEWYVMGSLVAETLRAHGCEVTLVSSSNAVSEASMRFLDQKRIQRHMMECDIDLVLAHRLTKIGESEVDLACTYSGMARSLSCESVVLVTSRQPRDELWHALNADPAALEKAGVVQVERIGDCLAPATIAAAVHSGHLYARTYGIDYDMETLRDRVVI